MDARSEGKNAKVSFFLGYIEVMVGVVGFDKDILFYFIFKGNKQVVGDN
jgi:hypothetical protein